MFCVITVNAQQQDTNIEDRYIEIDDINSLFIFNNNDFSEIINFELFNIYDNESSKPVFIDVNEIKNVHKFTIKSSSEIYENQRTCFLSVNKVNYLSTFRQVLLKMNVRYIKLNDTFIEIEKFFSENI